MSEQMTSADAEQPDRRRQRGISLFRASDAPGLFESGTMSPPRLDADDQRELAKDGPRPSTPLTALTTPYCSVATAATGSASSTAWFGPHFVLPRHTHDGDCLYYVLEGSLTMGSRVLAAGDGFFVPSDSPYAYEAGADGVVVLEFRTRTSFGMDILGGQVERWRRMATVAEEHGEAWAELRATQTS